MWFNPVLSQTTSSLSSAKHLVFLRSRAQSRLEWDHINLCEPQIRPLLDEFSLCFKRKKEKKKKRLQRVHWDYPEDRSVCPEGSSLFTNHSSWSNDRPRFSLQILSLLKWSSAAVWAKKPQSSFEVTVHHQILWEAPATCYCPKSQVCRCSKTLHKLQGVKLSLKETKGHHGTPSLLWQLLHPSQIHWLGEERPAEQPRNPTTPYGGQKSHSLPVPFCSALWCFAPD